MLRSIMAIPGRDSLRLYSLDLFSSAGISPEIEKLLKLRVSSMTEHQRVCILAFDETDILPEFSYHPRHDFVDGYVDLGSGERQCKKAEHALVFAILAKRWKQVFCYFLTPRSFTCSELKRIVILVLQIGFIVVATVCDGNGINRKLSSELGVSIENPEFEIEGKKLQFLFDVPHCFKNFRNHLLKRDFSVKLSLDVNRTIEGKVQWKHIRDCIRPMLEDSCLISSCPKITRSHLEPNNAEKMKVKLAVQIFRNSVSAAMFTAIEIGTLPKEAEVTAHFLKKMDGLFDMLNSSSGFFTRGKPWMCPLSKDSCEIRSIEEAIDFFTNNFKFKRK